MSMRVACLSAFLAGSIHAPPPAAPSAAPATPPLDWATLEKPFLTNHEQLTFRDKYVKAGESYFSPDGKWVIFQAVEVPEKGKEPSPFYAMYLAKLEGGKFTTIERVSPAGSANTCGWFHPTEAGIVTFGSTLITPKDEGPAGYQRGTSRYRWAFPAEMDVVAVRVKDLCEEQVRGGMKLTRTLGMPNILNGMSASLPKQVFTRPNYDAECSFDKTGRFLLYSHIEDAAKVEPAAEKPGTKEEPASEKRATKEEPASEKPGTTEKRATTEKAGTPEPPKADANIYIFDTKTKKQYPIVVVPGYDGGPFFSPDGKSICYRSDRKGNDLLQIFVADLKFEKDADGVEIPVGISQEYQLTDNEHVSWCPFWHPSGKFMLYATSEVSHTNYEVFAIEVNRDKMEAAAKGAAGAAVKVAHVRTRRITLADGADVLPAFNAEGTKVIWTSQRGPKIDGEMKPSSQLWIADWKGDPFSRW